MDKVNVLHKLQCFNHHNWVYEQCMVLSVNTIISQFTTLCLLMLPNLSPRVSTKYLHRLDWKKWLRLDWSVASKIRSRLWRKRTSRNYFKQHVDTFDTSKVQRGLWKLWKIGIQDHPKFAQGSLKNLTFSDSRSKLHLLVLRIELCIYMEVHSLKIKSRTLETHLHSNGHCLKEGSKTPVPSLLFLAGV